MGWVGTDLKDHLVPCPCHGQGHLPLGQAAKGFAQPGSEHCQCWGIHNLPQHLTTLTVKNFFPISSLNFLSFHFYLLFLALSLQLLLNSPSSPASLQPPQYWEVLGVSTQLLLSRTAPTFSACLLTRDTSVL